jgi:hypothetical protein
MNKSCAWFGQNYEGAKITPIMIIPTKRMGPGAAFSSDVRIMRQGKLNLLTGNVRSFFAEFGNLDLQDLSEAKVQGVVEAHRLAASDLTLVYTEKPVTR